VVTRRLAADSSYTLLDEIWARATYFVTHTPFWVLLIITVFLFAIFIYGIVKKLVVFAVLVGLLIAIVCGIWLVAGQAIS